MTDKDIARAQQALDSARLPKGISLDVTLSTVGGHTMAVERKRMANGAIRRTVKFHALERN